MQAALSVKGWERLPRDEIVTRACQAVAAVAHERSRNAELVYRLQQTHEEGLEARQLKERYKALQVRHCCPVCLSVCLSSACQACIDLSILSWCRASLLVCLCVCLCVCLSAWCACLSLKSAHVFTFVPSRASGLISCKGSDRVCKSDTTVRCWLGCLSACAVVCRQSICLLICPACRLVCTCINLCCQSRCHSLYAGHSCFLPIAEDTL